MQNLFNRSYIDRAHQTEYDSNGQACQNYSCHCTCCRHHHKTTGIEYAFLAFVILSIFFVFFCRF